MKEIITTIERIYLINSRYQRIELAQDAALQALKPGQSLLARLIDRDPEVDRWDPYLRERWWPVGHTQAGTLLVERPARQHYEVGQFVSVLGPIGDFYHFRKSLRSVLLIAYDSEPTPLTIMAPMLQRSRVDTTLILLGSARAYETTHLPPEIEVIRGEDDLTWHKQVLDVGNADQVFAVVGQDDELYRFAEIYAIFAQRRNRVDANYLFGVFQGILPCGVGACGACGVRLHEGFAAACLKGPAFDLTKVHLPALTLPTKEG